jgi:hypothetical protein
VARELVDLVAVTRGARRYHGAGALETLRRARALRRRGFTYPEAYGYGLFDPALPEDRRSGFVSKHENTAVQRLLNGEDSPPLVSDKVAFGLYCRAAGIPAPDLLAIVHAQGDGWAADGPVLRDESDWRAAVDAFPAGFVVKPADGYGGCSPATGTASSPRRGAGSTPASCGASSAPTATTRRSSCRSVCATTRRSRRSEAPTRRSTRSAW